MPPPRPPCPTPAYEVEEAPCTATTWRGVVLAPGSLDTILPVCVCVCVGVCVCVCVCAKRESTHTEKTEMHASKMDTATERHVDTDRHVDGDRHTDRHV